MCRGPRPSGAAHGGALNATRLTGALKYRPDQLQLLALNAPGGPPSLAPRRRPDERRPHMSLSGQLNDLSLGELIEFFCNQRKTGRLKVDYALAPGVFFIKDGQLVDAKVGGLTGRGDLFALTMTTRPSIQPGILSRARRSTVG